MRKALFLTTGLAWLALTGAASAVTVTVSDGPKNLTYFNSVPVGESNFTVGGDTWSLVSGSAATETGNLAGQYADPLGETGTYMTVFGGGTEQVVFGTSQTSLGIYWGSMDAGNAASITVDGYTLSGADLAAMGLGVNDNGSQTSPASNVLVTISGLGAFTTVQFSSTNNSFEFSLVPGGGVRGGGTPEPATWAMMMIGFAGLGYAAFRRNSKKGQMAISAI